MSHWSWHRESSILASYGQSHSQQPSLANGDWCCRTFPEGPVAPALDTQQTAASCTHEGQHLLHRLLPDGWSGGTWGKAPNRPWRRNVSLHTLIRKKFRHCYWPCVFMTTDDQSLTRYFRTIKQHVTKHIRRHGSMRLQISVWTSKTT